MRVLVRRWVDGGSGSTFGSVAVSGSGSNANSM